MREASRPVRRRRSLAPVGIESDEGDCVAREEQRDTEEDPMEQFMYVAWFRTSRVPVDDQDAQWPACFVIRAATASGAQAWGDQLARGMCSRRPDETFLWSRVDARDDPRYSEQNWAQTSEIVFGRWASDEEIGW